MKNKNRTIASACSMIALIALAPLSHVTEVYAANSKVSAWLKDMAPQERALQVCNMAMMEKLDADRLVDYTFSNPQVEGTSVKAEGAAYRINGHWYRVGYDCVTNEDFMAVTKLSFEKGNEIPKDNWTQYNLFD